MRGKVISIFVVPTAGAPMEKVARANAIPGTGLEGDRYQKTMGTWSNIRREAVRDISLISLEAIEKANRDVDVPFLPEETRRNIVTAGIPLNDFVGKEFYVGMVRMRGIELCDPCSRPSKLSRKLGFKSAFYGLGGIRAKILTSGAITVNDDISA